jgi:hypothetical protein
MDVVNQVYRQMLRVPTGTPQQYVRKVRTAGYTYIYIYVHMHALCLAYSVAVHAM